MPPPHLKKNSKRCIALPDILNLWLESQAAAPKDKKKLIFTYFFQAKTLNKHHKNLKKFHSW